MESIIDYRSSDEWHPLCIADHNSLDATTINYHTVASDDNA